MPDNELMLLDRAGSQQHAVFEESQAVIRILIFLVNPIFLQQVRDVNPFSMSADDFFPCARQSSKMTSAREGQASLSSFSPS